MFSPEMALRTGLSFLLCLTFLNGECSALFCTRGSWECPHSEHSSLPEKAQKHHGALSSCHLFTLIFGCKPGWPDGVMRVLSCCHRCGRPPDPPP